MHPPTHSSSFQPPRSPLPNPPTGNRPLYATYAQPLTAISASANHPLSLINPPEPRRASSSSSSSSSSPIQHQEEEGKAPAELEIEEEEEEAERLRKMGVVWGGNKSPGAEGEGCVVM